LEPDPTVLPAYPRIRSALYDLRVLRRHHTALIATALLSLALGACGGGNDSADTPEVANQPAHAASDFPPAGGRTLDQILTSSHAQHSNLVVSPTGKVFEPGDNRFGFGVFTVSRAEVPDAQVAIYAAPSGGGKASGPYPARIDSLAVSPQFESQTTKTDPDAAHDVYVTHLDFDHPGNWDLIALIRQGDGYEATLLPSIQVAGYDRIPSVGERPPAIHTPTAADVHGDLSKIDTRSPHDDMHGVDFASALGHEPVVLLFATPALCQSRVCGPVVDVAEEVKANYGDKVDFIHMEVYKHNNASDGLRPQLKAFGLPTEPWLFVMNGNGIISTRIEGGFGVSELEDAVRKVAG
jgi:hypothetical protein